MSAQPVTVVALSGSLKSGAASTAILHTAAAAAPHGVHVSVADWVRRLPHFDPDLEASPPHVVRSFREACERSVGVIMCVPEYAFGIPGAFKNALDWTVGSMALYRKPVTVLDIAPPGRGGNVRHALDLVLTALTTEFQHRSLTLSAADRDAEGCFTDPRLVAELRDAVGELVNRAAAAH